MARAVVVLAVVDQEVVVLVAEARAAVAVRVAVDQAAVDQAMATVLAATVVPIAARMEAIADRAAPAEAIRHPAVPVGRAVRTLREQSPIRI
jgi:hypothetical protein